MKRVLVCIGVIASILLSTSLKAQYCGGSSGSSICKDSTHLTNAGFYPSEYTLPCITVGQPYDEVIQFHTPATWAAGGYNDNLSFIQIDTINNLPCGLCWSCGASNFQIQGNSTGCIKISGTTFDAPGEYELHFIVDATTTFLAIPTDYANQNVAAQGLRYFLRVRLPGDTCAKLDTLVAGNTASHSGTITAPVITGATSVCTGDSTTLRVAGNNYYAYAWSTGSFNDSIRVGTGTYSVTVYGNCNKDSATTAVTIGAIQDTITASGPTTICQGSTVTLSVPAGSTYLWSNGATSNSINAGIAGNYDVTVTNSIGCSAVSSSVNVFVNPVPADTITASGPLTFCPGGSVILSGPSGLSYQWSNGNTSQSITASQSSTYTLIVTNNSNCSAISSQVTVTENALPNASVVAGGPTTFCPGDSVSLSGTPGFTYLWSNGDTSQSVIIYQAGSYTLTVTSANNCSAASAATTITFLAGPNNAVTASGPLSLCTGGSVELTAAPGLAYSWSNGSNAQSISASQSGNYVVTVTNANNCSVVSLPQVVTVNSAPDDTISASGPTTFCSGTSVVLSAITGYNYRWSTGSTNQNITVTQAGSYSVTITSGTSCSATSAPVVITVVSNPNNTVSIGGPTSFCAGGHVILTAVAGLNYLWSTGATSQAITVTQTGNYTVTVNNTNNCSAASSPVNVTVYTAPNATISASGPTAFCPGGSVQLSASAGFTYYWSNSLTTRSITVNQPGTYMVTATNVNSCTAVVTSPTIVVYNATNITTQPVNQVTCINGQVTFSVLASGTNLNYQWQKNGGNISGQQNPTYTISSAALSDTGNYRVVVSGLCGTDTSNNVSLSVANALTFSQQPVSQITCLGSSTSFTVVANGAGTTYHWKKDGQNITNANSSTYTINSTSSTDTGTYSCYVTSNCGNATSNTATLTIAFPTSSAISENICAGSSFNFNGHVLTAAGTYRDTLNNAVACDSIITLTLTVSPPPSYNYYDTICAGTTYNFNGTPLTTAGTYRDTLITHNGCDSIVILHLSFRQSSSSTTNAIICQGETYHFNGQSITSSGTYQDTLISATGCDSIAYLRLTVNQQTFSTVNAAICGTRTYNFNGRSLSAPGTYTDTISNGLGCDSIITLNLTNTSTVTYAYSASICAGRLYNFNGRIITTTGSYFDTIPVAGSCDSVVVLHLTVNPISASTLTQSICAGSTYLFGGRTLSASGTYYDTLNNVHGCDSIVTLNLTVYPPLKTNINAAICAGSSYSFNGQHLTSAGTYTAHYTAHNGCDSTVTLILRVGTFITDSISASICAGSFYNLNGRHITSTGTYNDTLTAQGGCDSIVVLQLNVTRPATGNASVTICTGSTYNFNGRQLTAPGTYTDTLAGTNGCDSIAILTLQVNSFIATMLFDTICQGSSYNFNGQSLSATGIYHDTLTAQGGCDSIVTLNLTVNHTASSTIYATICVGSTYLFNGVPLASTGTYFEALNGPNGCDSIVTLQLVVNSFITTNTAETICYGSSYSFYGRTLKASGTYSDTLTAQGGCDSIIVLNLTVSPIITNNINATICSNGTYGFKGQQLSLPGIYRDTLITHSGCDSVVVLHLDTTSVLTSTFTATVCSGSYYNFNGDTLTAPGIYTDTLNALAGCDSIVTLNLSLLPSYTKMLNQSVCSGDSIFFNGHYFHISGTFTDTLSTIHGCDSILTLNLNVNTPPVITWAQPDTICNDNDSTHITLVAPDPAGGTLTGNGLNGLTLTVHNSGNYAVTYSYTDSNGCSTSVTKNLLVETCLGIEEVIEGSSISIYPNPAGNVVTAQAEIFSTNHITAWVFDIMGNKIAVPFSQQADKLTFATNNLAAGVYLVRFNINGNVVSRHFIKAD